jgi:mRNA interferase MazF
VRRGEVYRLRIPRAHRDGHEQQGARYAVILQADALLPRSVVIVAPTSRSARPASFRPEITIAGTPTRVLVEQLGAVDAQRLGDKSTTLTPAEMWTVDDALATVLALR